MSVIADVFYSLRNSANHSTLHFSPHDLDAISIVFVICLFLVRTFKHSLGIQTSFKTSMRDGKQSDEGRHDELFTLPDHSLSMPLRLVSSSLKVFETAIQAQEDGLSVIEDNDAQLCLYLATITEPAMLLLLAKRGCPICPLGSVNVRNRFELLDPKLCREVVRDSITRFSTTGHASSYTDTSLLIVAKYPRPACRVKKGIEIVVEVTIVRSPLHRTADLAIASTARQRHEATAIFRQEFTILQFVKLSTHLATPGPNRLHQSTAERHAVEKTYFVRSIASDEPHVWAQLCKDYNPIHFSPFIAKVLGQPGQLAHGNHVVGTCIQGIRESARSLFIAESTQIKDNRLMERLSFSMMRNETVKDNFWWMEVQFRRPFVVPGEFGLVPYKNADGFDVLDTTSGKISIEVNYGHTR